MATFMDEHSGMAGLTEAQFQAAHEADLAIQAEEGARFVRAWLDPAAGKAFCYITAPSREAAIRVHERTGHPADAVYEVTVEV
jgi:hypothetical protein